MDDAKGKFIVFDGIDGSGKNTQVNLLSSHLKELGYNVAKIDFPQYGKKSAGLVEEYLNGTYGTAREVGAKKASIFYACDRYDASFQIKEWLDNGYIVISDRYVTASIGHQGGKIRDRQKRSEYFKWLYGLEYNFFGIPKPDITFILKTTPELSLGLSSKHEEGEKKAKRQLYLLDKDQDMHEEDVEHQKHALESFLQVAEEYPEEFRVIECVQNENMLAPSEIHKLILAQIEGEFNHPTQSPDL